MNKISIMMLLSLTLVGCGSKETTSAGPTAQPAKPQAAHDAMRKNQAYIDEGLNYLQHANVVAAIKSFDSAIKENPKDPRGYIVLGQTYLRLKEYNRAIDTFSAVTHVAPEDGEGYYMLAVTYGLSGDKALAQENAKKSIAIFQAQKNQERFMRSVALLNGLTKEE